MDWMGGVLKGLFHHFSRSCLLGKMRDVRIVFHFPFHQSIQRNKKEQKMASKARYLYEQAVKVHDKWRSKLKDMTDKEMDSHGQEEGEEWKKQIRKHEASEPPKLMSLAWNATFSASSNPEAFEEIQNTLQGDASNGAPSQHLPLDMSNLAASKVVGTLLLERMNKRQQKYHFFLQSGIGKQRTANRSHAIKRVVSVWVLSDYGRLSISLEEAKAENARLKAEVAILLKKAEASMSLPSPTNLFGPPGGALIPPTASTKKKVKQNLVPLTASTKKKFAGRSHSTPPKSSKKVGRAPKTPAPKSYNADKLAKVMARRPAGPRACYALGVISLRIGTLRYKMYVPRRNHYSTILRLLRGCPNISGNPRHFPVLHCTSVVLDRPFGHNAFRASNADGRRRVDDICDLLLSRL
jgi:hypothetical protein